MLPSDNVFLYIPNGTKPFIKVILNRLFVKPIPLKKMYVLINCFWHNKTIMDLS